MFAKSKRTCPRAALGVPSADLEPESLSPFTPPPPSLHLPFRLIWCVWLVWGRGGVGGGTGSVISKEGGAVGARCQATPV